MPASISRVSVSGTWWRHTRSDAGALTLAPPQFNGRWQRGRTIRALYLADREATMWAEFYRSAAELEVPPGRLLPRRAWRLAVALDNVADLSTLAALESVGLAAPEPTSAQWPAFQTVGERLAADRASAILYPASAHHAGLCLCVFEPALAGVSAHGEPELISEPPPVPRGLRT